MINALTSLGFGIISLAVIIGIGIVILVTLGSNVASTSATANTTLNTLAGYLGTSSGGLATWVNSIDAPLRRNSHVETPEYRLKSLYRKGQDRSVKHKNYARETNKGHFTFSIEDESEIYSPNLCYT